MGCHKSCEEASFRASHLGDMFANQVSGVDRVSGAVVLVNELFTMSVLVKKMLLTK